MNRLWNWMIKEEEAPLERILKLPFELLAQFYKFLVSTRAVAYNYGILKKEKLSVPVVSVGNLSLGGTGKTALVSFIAREFSKRGKRIGILIRGYGGKGRGIKIVSKGKGALISPRQAGDEAYFLAQELEGVWIVAGRDRASAGRLAIEEAGCEILILDDGFQHIGLERDLNIVLIDTKRDIFKERLFPRGTLREGLKALSRAGIIVLSKAEAQDKELEERLRVYGKDADFFWLRYLPKHSAELKGKKGFALCAIGSPEYFFELCRKAGIELVGQVSFLDHHWYDQKELKKIEKLAVEKGADFIITTRKDMVRLKEWENSIELKALDIELDFYGEEEKFFSIVEKKLVKGN